MTDDACPDCAESATRPWHGFTARCQACAARAVSRGPNFHRCRSAGVQDRKYRSELEALGVTHEQVMEAARVDKLDDGRDL